MAKPLVVAFKLHKWLGLIVGLQVLVWLVSGLYMVAVDIDFIHGDTLVKNLPQAISQPHRLNGLNSLKKRYPAANHVGVTPVMGEPHYTVTTPGEWYLVESQSGEVISPLSEEAARAIARYHFNGDGPVIRASMITTDPPMEIQTRKLPLWRIDFGDRFSTSFYIDPYTGSLVTRRHQYWRVFDFFWMLHIMDYDQRVNAHGPLLIIAELAGLVLGISGIWLLVHRLSNRRKSQARRRLMPFLKQVHKWLSLFIGLQVMLWLISGLVISLLDPAKVSGRFQSRPQTSETEAVPAGSLLEPSDLPADALVDATAINLFVRNGVPVYQVQYAETDMLLDARDGSVLDFGKSEAENIALEDFSGNGEITAITSGIAPDLETRNSKGTYWKVDFSDTAKTSIYVSAANGEILERRNRYWRIRDFFWMLHIMDYKARKDFNSALVISMAAISLWLGISGFLLLFGSFKRRDFRFLLRRGP